MTVDVVYVVGGPTDDNRDDLRHSLRSVVENLHIGFRDLVVVGDVPDWFAGVAMPLEPKPGKFDNQRASITAYVNHPGAADTFVLMNDDMLVTEAEAEIVTSRYVNPLSSWSATHRATRHGHGWECWQCSIIDTADWAAEQTGTDPWLYECHSPLLFDTTRLRDVLAAYPTDRRFVVGEVYPLAGAGDEGAPCGNAKVKKDDPDVLASKLANPMPYLSSSPASWAGVVGAWARTKFPVPCRYEK